jgi:transposase-like protein
MEVFTKRCPDCRSSKNRIVRTYETQQNGTRALYQCQACECQFSETKHTFLERIRTPLSEIWRVLNARTDGMGLNAAVRTFDDAKNTILTWERTCAALQEVFVLYALLHRFAHHVLEGDDAYTKVGKTVPPSESEGWTIALMDRASRFFWELDCGKRKERLFQRAIDRLAQVIEQTGDVT